MAGVRASGSNPTARAAAHEPMMRLCKDAHKPNPIRFPCFWHTGPRGWTRGRLAASSYIEAWARRAGGTMCFPSCTAFVVHAKYISEKGGADGFLEIFKEIVQ